MHALDTSDLKVNVALWVISPEYDDWRLLLASSALDQIHPLKAYQEVIRVLRDNHIHMRPPLLILPMKDPFVRDLRKTFSHANDVDGMRLGGQSFGNRFISDAYVYRIR
jgi:hypothetical protein